LENTLVEIDNVVKTYPKSTTPSVDGISLSISKGSIIGIFGPNGAGKTTLISMLCGLLEPTSGSIQYHHNNEIISPKQARKFIGYVPQDFSFYPELTAVQNLRFFGAQYGVEKNVLQEKINDLLEKVGLIHVKNKKVATYSGGMKRRFNLVIALLHDPEMLFLDEPTVGVDVQSKMAIMDILQSLNQRGTTIVYTSHHLKEAEDLCDSMLLIDHGKTIAHDNLPNLLANHHVSDLENLLLKLTGTVLRD
jgi:ABC-2 type transport system ATP-binding protein